MFGNFIHDVSIYDYELDGYDDILKDIMYLLKACFTKKQNILCINMVFLLNISLVAAARTLKLEPRHALLYTLFYLVKDLIC